ncbi:hypothetical protein MAP00_003962 [Monascus purpureus]|nr:hypothetical protein MAP00_003962 [Monascus purpureus]
MNNVSNRLTARHDIQGPSLTGKLSYRRSSRLWTFQILTLWHLFDCPSGDGKTGHWFRARYLEEKSLSANYCCVFGISHHIPGISKCTFHHTLNEKFSFLIANGPDDRTYFFLFEHLGKIFHGSETSRFTEKELHEIVNRHLDDPITPDFKFCDIYSRRIRAVMTPLEENACRKWYLNAF